MFATRGWLIDIVSWALQTVMGREGSPDPVQRVPWSVVCEKESLQEDIELVRRLGVDDQDDEDTEQGNTDLFP